MSGNILTKKRKINEVTESKILSEEKLQIDDNLLCDHTNNVEIASLKILEFLLKYDIIELIWSTNGRIADLYAVNNFNIENLIGIQVKACVKNNSFNFTNTIAQYKGMLIICMDFKEELLNKIIKDDLITSEDIKLYLRYLSITTPYHLNVDSTRKSLHESDIHDYKINPRELGIRLKQYFDDDSLIKQSLLYWECLGASKHHHIEYESTQKILYDFKKLNLDFVQVYPCLPFDAYLKYNNKIYRIQFKTISTKYGYVRLYHTKHGTVNDIKYYNESSFDILFIHDLYLDTYSLIPMKVLIDANILGDHNKHPRIKCKDFQQYKLDLDNNDFFNNFKQFMNTVQNSNSEAKDNIEHFKLPGCEYRKDLNYLKQSYELVSTYSHQELLDYYNNLVELYESEYDLLSIYDTINNKITRWPNECPSCAYKNNVGNRVGTHMIKYHPTIMNNYRVHIISTLKLPRFKCSNCLKTYTRKDSFYRHVSNSNACTNNHCIQL